MEAVEQARDHGRRFLDRRPRRHAHDQLVESALERRPAELALGHGHGHVDLVRGAGERDSLDFAGASARGEDADHGQPLFVDLQRTAHRGLEAEQLAAHAVADDAHLREGLFVARAEEPALAHGQLDELRVVVGDADHLGLRAAFGRQDLPGLDLDLGDHALDAGHGVADGVGVAERQARALAPDLLLFVVAVEDLVLDEHVAQAHGVDGLQGLPLGPGADREHGDDRSRAEDDAEGGEHRAQAVAAQALDARAQGLVDLDHGGASAGPAAAPAAFGRAGLREGSRRATWSPGRTPFSTTIRETLLRPTVTSTGTKSPPSRR